MVFQTLNKLKWTGKIKDCKVIIRDSKESDNRKIISGQNITELKKTYLLYKSRDEEVFIPLHRIAEIRYKERLLWRKCK
jgi:uncharacterized protein (UPF0248 family)